MHINYRYVLHFAELQRGGSSSFTVLDYGCGAGDVVVAGRERGMNFFSELFYAPEEASANPQMGNRAIVERLS
jgi:hypothetical protein